MGLQIEYTKGASPESSEPKLTNTIAQEIKDENEGLPYACALAYAYDLQAGGKPDPALQVLTQASVVHNTGEHRITANPYYHWAMAETYKQLIEFEDDDRRGEHAENARFHFGLAHRNKNCQGCSLTDTHVAMLSDSSQNLTEKKSTINEVAAVQSRTSSNERRYASGEKGSGFAGRGTEWTYAAAITPQRG